jgi:predicted ABC-type ATPase
VADGVSQQSLESAYRRIERDALQHSQPQDRPHAILLGGQPGSGKSVLSDRAQSDLRQSGGSIVIDADRMREEHPRYQQLSKEDPLNAADRTHKEAGQWAQRLTATAIEERRNLVIDGTMRNPEAMQELASRLKEHGYTVEARVMAVDAETSMTRARLRFEESVESRGTGRFVNREQHDNAYEGLPKSVEALERAKLTDSVKLYDRHHRVIYDNTLERGEWKHAPAATPAMEQERSRDWTHAQRADYVITLERIYDLARAREGSRENVTYHVGTAVNGESTVYKNVYDAAQTFREAKVEDRPYAERITVLPNGRKSGTLVAHTTSVAFQDEVRHVKSVGGADELFKRAYENGSQFRAGAADLEVLGAKLDAASSDLVRFEKSETFQRAQAFDMLSAKEALARHPELDGAFKQLQEIKQGLPASAVGEQRDALLAGARADLSEQIHRGEIPKGNVSLEESRHYIDTAADARGYALVRDAGELKRDVQGEVVAISSHHALVQTSTLAAVRFEKASLDREVHVGDNLAIYYGNDKSQVYDAGKEPHRPAHRDSGRDMER